MKSHRLESSSSPTGVSRLIGSFAIFSTVRTLSSGQLHLLRELLGRRLAAEGLHQVALRAHQLVDRLDHVHGMRIVRAWSAMARVMAWRIHQVA